MTVRDIERAVAGRQLTSGTRARFQASALLARAERAHVRNDEALTPAQRDTQLKRLEGLATILAQIATREPSLFSLLQEDADVSTHVTCVDRKRQWSQAKNVRHSVAIRSTLHMLRPGR